MLTLDPGCFISELLGFPMVQTGGAYTMYYAVEEKVHTVPFLFSSFTVFPVIMVSLLSCMRSSGQCLE